MCCALHSGSRATSRLTLVIVFVVRHHTLENVQFQSGITQGDDFCLARYTTIFSAKGIGSDRNRRSVEHSNHSNSKPTHAGPLYDLVYTFDIFHIHIFFATRGVEVFSPCARTVHPYLTGKRELSVGHDTTVALL